MKKLRGVWWIPKKEIWCFECFIRHCEKVDGESYLIQNAKGQIVLDMDEARKFLASGFGREFRAIEKPEIKRYREHGLTMFCTLCGQDLKED